MKSENPYIKIEANGSYESFADFYDVNKDTIYRNIVKLYNGLTKTKKDELTMVVLSVIDDFEWTTTMIFNKKETSVLMGDVLSYFEDTEEYEICEEIIKIHKKINNKKS